MAVIFQKHTSAAQRVAASPNPFPLGRRIISRLFSAISFPNQVNELSGLTNHWLAMEQMVNTYTHMHAHAHAHTQFYDDLPFLMLTLTNLTNLCKIKMSVKMNFGMFLDELPGVVESHKP